MLQLVAHARIPRDAARALVLGRLIALRKLNGSMALLLVTSPAPVFLPSKRPKPSKRLASPFQFALSTRAGAESVVHFLAAASELNPEATIVSVDGIGAFDTMSRRSMLQGAGGKRVSPVCPDVLHPALRAAPLCGEDASVERGRRMQLRFCFFCLDSASGVASRP